MRETFTPDMLSAMPADEVRRRLDGPVEERAAFVRAAGDAGIAEAQAIYGQMLLDGDGVPRDEGAAVRWFWQAAAQGYVPAINMLGRCYDLGRGVPIDKARAAEWYRAAADRGLDWGLYNLATLMALGHGVPEDKAGALALFRKAADLTGHPKSINYVAGFHEEGEVVDRDMAEAARLYALAAAGGDFRGMFNHARMLLHADRHDEAMAWIARALEAGNDRFRGQVRAWLAERGLRPGRDAASA